MTTSARYFPNERCHQYCLNWRKEGQPTNDNNQDYQKVKINKCENSSWCLFGYAVAVPADHESVKSPSIKSPIPRDVRDNENDLSNVGVEKDKNNVESDDNENSGSNWISFGTSLSLISIFL